VKKRKRSEIIRENKWNYNENFENCLTKIVVEGRVSEVAMLRWLPGAIWLANR